MTALPPHDRPPVVDVPAEDTDWRQPSRPMQFVIVSMAVVLGLMLGTAGVPGAEVPVAGDGSERLRLGWMEQHIERSEPGGEVGLDDDPDATDTDGAPLGAPHSDPR